MAQQQQGISSPPLLFGEKVSLKSFDSGTTIYSNTQALVQQVAYTLADKIFAYSPETFALDAHLKQWKEEGNNNGFGFIPDVQSLETRLGAGRIALGYVFSPDFDLAKRHIPQAIVASAGSLSFLRETLEQLSLLHSLANPMVLHINAASYHGGTSPALFSEYSSSQEIADDLGFNLVASHSIDETQHISLLSTLLSKIVTPTIHVYDGLTSRDTALVTPFSQDNLRNVYQSIIKKADNTEMRHSDNEGKALLVFQSLNQKLGTSYKPFEYHGHAQAERVIVTFGSQESSLSASIANILAQSGEKVGAINVRLYRPFIEDEFKAVLPQSARELHVLGQVEDASLVEDDCNHSRLFQDVFAAMSLSFLSGNSVTVQEIKYAKQQVWSFSSMTTVFEESLASSFAANIGFETDSSSVQVDFWTLNESSDSTLSGDVAHVIVGLEGELHIHSENDNLVQGGVSRTRLTIGNNSSKSSDVFKANVTYIGSEKILQHYDLIENTRAGGAILLSSGIKIDDLEKVLPAEFRSGLLTKNISLWTLDAGSYDAQESFALTQLSILQILGTLGVFNASSSAVYESQSGTLAQRSDLKEKLEEILLQAETPSQWEIQEDVEKNTSKATSVIPNSFVPFTYVEEEATYHLESRIIAAKGAVFKEAYGTRSALRPDAGVKTAVVHVKEHRRLTPMSYDRNVFHIEFDLGDSGLTYAIGEALGIHAENDSSDIQDFIKWYGLNSEDIVQVPSREDESILENRTVYQALMQNMDIFGKPPKRFYETLAEYATDENDKKNLLTLSLPEGATEFKRRSEVDTITYADLLVEFPSARPSFSELIKIVSPLKRREYSIASAQHVTPNSVALLIVTVGWVDPKGRDRFGLATRYLNSLKVGTPVTVSVKPSVMKLPAKTTAPIIMAGLGTGLAPFRAFVQERAYQKQVLGQEIGSILLYLGSRHQREEYLYGEEWEAYQAAGIVTLIGKAFSRDQPHKIYIQDRMRQTMEEIRQAYIREDGSFYLCGPTWPVPDVTEVLQEAVEIEAKSQGAKKVDGRREIETLKEDGRFVLEVY